MAWKRLPPIVLNYHPRSQERGGVASPQRRMRITRGLLKVAGALRCNRFSLEGGGYLLPCKPRYDNCSPVMKIIFLQ